MSSLFSALNISAGALQVNQSAISIVSNNIANINTEGYSKQKVNLGTLVINSPISNNVDAQVDSSIGVELVSVSRYTTTFLGSYYRNQISEQASYNEQAQIASDIAGVFDELQGKGLDKELEDFYTALDNLSKSPTDKTTRISFIDSASALTEKMNKLSSELNEIKNQNVGDGISQSSLNKSDIAQSINALNQNIEDLAKLNKMIATSQTGTLENNNLLDKRDLLLKEISKYGNFEESIQENGTVNLKLDGTQIINGSTIKSKFNVKTAAQYDEYCQQNGIENKNECNAVVYIEKNDGSTIANINNKFESGEIGGILKANTGSKDKNINTVLSELDTLASTIANVFNQIQTQKGAYYLENNNGTIQLSNANLENYEIFTTKDGSDTIKADNITVNSIFKEDDGYNKIATAYFPDNQIDYNAVGNINNIISMINTKNDTTTSGFDSIGNISFSEYYNGIIGKVASNSDYKTNLATSQDSIVASLDNKIKEQTGVDLNEELSDMVKFQTAFSASARVFETCNNMLETLVHLGE